MSTHEWITIAAVLVAPLLALQAQRMLDRLREHWMRKVWILNTLLATRANRTSFDHVAALNRIYLDFDGFRFWKWRWQTPAEKAVIDAWRAYSDQLNQPFADTADEQRRMVAEQDRLFVELLFELSRALRYNFDKVHLKREIYSPVAHGQLESDQRIIRESLRDILSGSSPIPVAVLQSDDGPNSALRVRVSSTETPRPPQGLSPSA